MKTHHYTRVNWAATAADQRMNWVRKESMNFCVYNDFMFTTAYEDPPNNGAEAI